MKTKEEIRIEFYGEHDARAYDHDELYIMEQYAKEYHEQQVNLLNKPAVSSSLREMELNKYLEEINTLMWNTWGVKHNKFDKEEGSKIMSILNRWASNDC